MSEQANPILEVSKLNAFYGKSQVVFDLGLRVEEGEAVAVLGRNGAGKTSTLMALAGVVRCESETLRLSGIDLNGMTSFKRVHAGLSLVPSGSRSFPNLTIEENLGMVKGSKVAVKGSGWGLKEAYEQFPKLEELKKARQGEPRRAS